MTDINISSLPVPTEEEKQQYIQGTAVTAVAPASQLPIPTSEEIQKYIRASAPVSDISSLPVPSPEQRQQILSVTPAQGIDKELEERSFFDRPALRAQEVRTEEVSAIAHKFGVDPEQLQTLAPYFGARMPGKEVQEAAGYVGELALGIPQKLYKIAQDPKMERALDELQGLASGRESYLGLAGQVAAPVIPGVGPGASLGKAALHGLGIGAVAGGVNAPRGQEIQGAAFGAGLGSVLGAIGNKIARRAVPDIEKEVAEQVIRKAAPDIDKGTKDILTSQADSLGEISDRVLLPAEKAPELTTEVAEKILRQQVDPDTLTRYLDPSSEENALLRRRAMEEIPEKVRDEGLDSAVRGVAAQDVIDRNQQDFARWLTGDTAAGKNLTTAEQAIQEYAERQGGEAALRDRWSNFLTERAGEQYVTDSYIRPGREANFLNKAINHISDAQFVLRDIDQRSGTILEPIHNELNTQINRMSYARQGFQKDLDSVFREAKATGVDKTVLGTDKLYTALDTGNFSSLTPEEAEVAHRFQQYFDKGLEYVNGISGVADVDKSITPLSIPHRENYVPYQMLSARDLESTIQSKLQSTGLDIENLDKGQFAQALQTSPELAEVIDGMGVISSMAPPRTGPELLARIHDTFSSRSGLGKLETSARASLERGEKSIPLWMRETNLYKLADSWTTSTLRHLYLRDPIEKIVGQVKVLQRTGAELEVGYLRNLLADLQGSREGTAAAYSNSMGDRYNRTIDQLVLGSKMPGAEEIGGVAKALPAMFRDATRNIYANFLGMSSHAALLQVFLPFVKTLPEIGMTPYGTYSFLRGTYKVLADFSRYEKEVQLHGLVPVDMIPKYRQAIEEGIRRSSLYALPMDAVQKLSEVSLYVFRKFDTIIRILTHGMAESIVSDLGQGSVEAQKALARLPSTLQRSLQSAGSPEEATHILSVYLNASSSYNYNRASMSEFGRTMGPFFSTFTKWPTATAGEIMAEYREKGMTRGTIRNFEKFMAPLIVLKTVDSLIKKYGGEDGEFSDREKMAIGRSGLSAAAPLGTLESIASGKLFAPPAVDLFLKAVVEPLKSQDPAKLKSALISGLQEFAPGAVYVRFFTDDLVTYLKGHRPEGTNFLERTASGARELNK